MQRDGGPGAGGNPTGGSFTGPAEALEIVLDFAYAYSGVVAVGTGGQSVPVTMNKFTTGNYLFVGKFQWYRGTQSNSGMDYMHKVKLNGATILEIEDSASTSFEQDSADLVIPAYTEVEATSQNDTSAADNNIAFTFTGRIYRG